VLKSRIIPCLDVDKGRVVKGVNFLDLRDAGDPVEIAKIYDLQGADQICFLDITASHEDRGIIFDIITRTAEQCFMPLTVGGGVRTINDVRNLLLAGADKVSINTAAITNPLFVKEAADKFGSQCIVVALDAKKINKEKENSSWEIYTHGGRNRTGLDVIEFAKKMVEYGAGEILLTSMDKDGTRSGFDIELTNKMSTSVSVPVIASGGVGNLAHLASGIINGKADAVLAASIFHFGEYTILEAKEYMKDQGIDVRID